MFRSNMRPPLSWNLAPILNIQSSREVPRKKPLTFNHSMDQGVHPLDILEEVEVSRHSSMLMSCLGQDDKNPARHSLEDSHEPRLQSPEEAILHVKNGICKRDDSSLLLLLSMLIVLQVQQQTMNAMHQELRVAHRTADKPVGQLRKLVENKSSHRHGLQTLSKRAIIWIAASKTPLICLILFIHV